MGPSSSSSSDPSVSTSGASEAQMLFRLRTAATWSIPFPSVGCDATDTSTRLGPGLREGSWSAAVVAAVGACVGEVGAGDAARGSIARGRSGAGAAAAQQHTAPISACTRVPPLAKTLGAGAATESRGAAVGLYARVWLLSHRSYGGEQARAGAAQGPGTCHHTKVGMLVLQHI